MRASSIFPILSVGLLFFGGLCVAASEFYKSKHNVILSAGIFFVSAGKSCLAGSGAGRLSCCGRTRRSRRWVMSPPGPLDSGVHKLSCPGGKILTAGKNQQKFLASGRCGGQRLARPSCSAPSGLGAGAAAEEGLPRCGCPAPVLLGSTRPQDRFWETLLGRGARQQPGLGRGTAAALQGKSLLRGLSFWVAHSLVCCSSALPLISV